MFPKAEIPSVAGRDCVDKGRRTALQKGELHTYQEWERIYQEWERIYQEWERTFQEWERTYIRNGRGHIKNGGGSQLELDGRGRGGAGQKGDERKLVR